MPHSLIRPVPTSLFAALLWAASSASALLAADETAAPPAPALASTPAPAAPATYAVNISPTWTVGQKFGYVAEDNETSLDGQSNIHFEAEGEVLALLPSGNPQKIAYTLKVLLVTGTNGAPDNLPRPGAKIVVEFAPKGKKNVTVNDKPADQDAADFLEQVLWITTRNHPDQEFYGPPKPVAVGASWPFNSAAFLDYNEEGDAHFTNAEGSLKLQSVSGEGDQRLAVIAGTFTLKGKDPPSAPGSFVGQYHFTASVPLGRQGVFKETVTSTTTDTPPPALLGIFKKSATISQETVVQEVTVR